MYYHIFNILIFYKFEIIITCLTQILFFPINIIDILTNAVILLFFSKSKKLNELDIYINDIDEDLNNLKNKLEIQDIDIINKNIALKILFESIFMLDPKKFEKVKEKLKECGFFILSKEKFKNNYITDDNFK